MLYILYGNDLEKRKEKQAELSGGRLIEVFSVENFVPGQVLELIGSTGLFSEEKCIVLRDLYQLADSKQWLLDNRQLLAESPHTVILVEDSLTKTELKKWEKYSESFSFELAKSKGQEFNSFALTDAVGRRDKKQSWLIYQQALRHGKVAEELHGLIFWMLKTMLLVSYGSDHGLKPFVAKKAAGFARNYSPAELKKTSAKLVDLYHQSRRGGAPLELALEKFLLTL